MFIPSLKEKERTLIKALGEIDQNKRMAFFIGPEGDFTDQEYQLANENKCIAVTLGCLLYTSDAADE